MEQILGKSSDDILENPRQGGPGLTTNERRSLDFTNSIMGWGSDLDRSVRPGVPMDKNPDIGVETLYPEITPQIPNARVLKSLEHAKLPPVFGNVCPPRGLSGLIRNYAYSFSEGPLRHWLLLVLADRIDVVEEFFSDLFHLEIPNIPKEMGIYAAWKYDRKRLIRNAAIVSAGILAVSIYLKSRKR